MLLLILFYSFNAVYSRPLKVSPCHSNQPCNNIERSQANFLDQSKKLLSLKRFESPLKSHVGHRSKRKLNSISNPNARIRRGAEKGMRKWWKKILINGRQGNSCQRNICWSRDNKWSKKNKGRKKAETKNMNQSKKGRKKGWGQRTKNWGCLQHKRKMWSAQNKRKVRKSCTKGGCIKRKRWQNESRSIKKIVFKRRGCGGRGKTGCRRKAKNHCRWGTRRVVQREPSKNVESIDPMSFLEK